MSTYIHSNGICTHAVTDQIHTYRYSIMQILLWRGQALINSRPYELQVCFSSEFLFRLNYVKGSANKRRWFFVRLVGDELPIRAYAAMFLSSIEVPTNIVYIGREYMYLT